MTDPNLLRLRALVAAGLAELEARRQEVNDLNVFPVADGDTGDNMALTLRSVLEELDRLAQSDQSLDEIGRDQIVESVGRAALLGARGNSGVILSQLIRGATEELIARPGELIGPALIAAGMARAADRAYGSVREPAEGTMLTVAREMAARLSSEVANLDDARVQPGTAQEEQDQLIANVLEYALETGRDSVRRGPQLLPALREAGVVDSGAHAITIILSGVLGQLRGQPPAEIDRYAAPARTHRPEHDSETYRYCTNFAVTGTGLDAAAWRERLEAHGDSLLVVGDQTTLKIHIHTDDPEAATALFDEIGEVSRLDIADMHQQVEQRAHRLAHEPEGPAARCGVVAVHSGPGAGILFTEQGAVVVDGGPTMNPATADLLSAIHACSADEVVVLPNSPNVHMAADRAAQLSEKPTRVIPTRSQAEGLSIAALLESDASAEENADAGAAQLAGLRSGGIAEAAKDDASGRFRKGDALGYVGDELVAWGEREATVRTTLAQLAEGAELVTCLVGAGAPLGDDELRSLAPDEIELEVLDGGQQAWWWLLAAE
ncbi:MAG: DAK2 domain-containing protein [Solirubrobacteraceae bacterium]|nr:DAK2 domain-containing protein [Solirubrobacteraceae bacterium]